jgi:hypothetical protein
MLELLLIGLLVSTWIGFVAYGAWFFSSARAQAEAQELFSELYNSSKDAISARRKRKKQERISNVFLLPNKLEG